MYSGRINVSARRKNAPRPAEKSADQYLKWLRGRPCFLANHRAGGCGVADIPRKSPVEAAHVDHGGKGTSGAKGGQTKAADRWAIPLCQRHHDEQGGQIGAFRTRGGWRTFQLKYGFDAVDIAAAYWARWPGRRAWEESQCA